MLNLPENVLVKIFSFLTPCQRGLARQVCRAWETASSHPMLLETSALCLVGSFGGLSLRVLLWNERIKHLRVKYVDNSQWAAQLDRLEDNEGKYVVALVLDNCSITFSTFISLLKVFSGLQSLTINGINTIFMTGQLTGSDASFAKTVEECWSRLNRLELINISYLNDDNFGALFYHTNANNFHQLTLKSIKLSYHLESMTKGSLLCFSTLHKFMTLRAAYLSELCFDFSNVRDPMLQDIAAIKHLCLSRLSLVSCRDITDLGLVTLINSQPSLVSVDLSQLTDISAKSLSAIGNTCKGLKQLIMNKCNSVVGRLVIPTLQSLPLEHIELSECNRIDCVDLQSLCCKGQGIPTLKTLKAEYCAHISDNFLVPLCTNSPDLVNLSFCSVGEVGIDGMSAIKSLENLRSLKLGWSRTLDDFHILGVKKLGTEENRRKLKRGMQNGAVGHVTNEMVNQQVNEEGEGLMANENVASVCVCDFTNGFRSVQNEAECPLYTGVNLSSLRRLQNLDFSACENITDLAIIHAFKFYDLRSLNLSMCRHVTGRGVEALCRNCPSLENLNLSYTPVDDEGIWHVAKRLRILRTLILASCALLTDKAISYLEAYSFHLTELDVSLCPGITIEQIEHFQRSVPTVHSIKSRFISSGTFLETSQF